MENATNPTTDRAETTQRIIDNPPPTECYYRHLPGRLVFTEGIMALANAAGAHWLIDAVSSHQSAKLDAAADGMQFWALMVRPDKSALLTCRKDSGLPALVAQEIEFTDFPLPEVGLWVEGTGKDRVLLLPREH